MPEVTASTETDIAVAKACEFHWSTQPIRGEFVVGLIGQGEFRPFRPSTDLNDALLAAEKFGLFSGNWSDHSLCKFDSEDWQIRSDHLTMDAQSTSEQLFVGEIVACAETPALAICAAILKLAEAKCTPSS